MSLQDIFPILLEKLVDQGKYNEAENMLFEELERNPSKKLIKTGENFYATLLWKSDIQLSKENFSREEIFQGLEDIKKINGVISKG